MKKAIFLLLIIIFLLPMLVVAEPMPRGIAINDETKECTGFSSGDEFTISTLPSGWADYYPGGIFANDPNTDPDIIVTDYGQCNYELDKAESCCNQLELTYVEDPGIKHKSTDLGRERLFESFTDPVFIAVASLVLIIAIIIIVAVILIIRKIIKNK